MQPDNRGSRSEIVVLQVPGKLAHTPYMQTTVDGLVESCVEHLRLTFDKADTRNKVTVNGIVRSAEFHRLSDRDPEAGLILLDFLMSQGFTIERVDVSSSEYGDTIRACVYILRR